MTQEEDQNCASLDYIFAHRGDKTAFWSKKKTRIQSIRGSLHILTIYLHTYGKDIPGVRNMSEAISVINNILQK